MTTIPPTVGRVVLYKPNANEHLNPDASGFCAATVSYVHSDTMVNLCVLSGSGTPTPRSSVRLVQEGEEVPGPGGYCQWMKYQLGQAARAEAAEKAAQASK